MFPFLLVLIFGFPAQKIEDEDEKENEDEE
jgi:hypothetical protein